MAGLFPKAFDNQYRGSRIALIILGVMLTLKFVIGVNISGFNPFISARDVLVKVDGVPLDQYSPEAAEQIIFMSGAWGLGMILFSLMGFLALIRYRAMVPFIFLLLLFEQIGRKALAFIRDGGFDVADNMRIAATINWGFVAFLALGLVLSLAQRRAN